MAKWKVTRTDGRSSEEAVSEVTADRVEYDRSRNIYLFWDGEGGDSEFVASFNFVNSCQRVEE